MDVWYKKGRHSWNSQSYHSSIEKAYSILYQSCVICLNWSTPLAASPTEHCSSLFSLFPVYSSQSSLHAPANIPAKCSPSHLESLSRTLLHALLRPTRSITVSSIKFLLSPETLNHLTSPILPYLLDSLVSIRKKETMLPSFALYNVKYTGIINWQLVMNCHFVFLNIGQTRGN